MSVLGVIGAAAGLASTLYGAHNSATEAKKQEGLLANQKAANEAWYNRNYYQDYLNTVRAQNALKQYRNAWGERVREARARQAITGGTPEQAAAVAEAGGEAMANTLGNLAAQGEQNRLAIDSQKLAMDNNMSQQQAAIAEARQQAASNLMSSGVSLLGSSLQSFEGKPDGGEETSKAASGEVSSDIKTPETKNVDTSAATQTATAKPATTAAAPAIPAMQTPKIEVPENTLPKNVGWFVSKGAENAGVKKLDKYYHRPTVASSVARAEGSGRWARGIYTPSESTLPAWESSLPPSEPASPVMSGRLARGINTPSASTTAAKVASNATGAKVAAPATGANAQNSYKASATINGKEYEYDVYLIDGKYVVDADKNSNPVFAAMRNFLKNKEGGINNVYYLKGEENDSRKAKGIKLGSELKNQTPK